MKVLYTYTIREFLKLLAICMLIFFVLYLVIDFVQKADNFIDSDVPAYLIVKYFIYKIPYIFIQLLPAATLISSIILFSNMKRNNELLAVKICGINPFVFFNAMLVVALFLSLFLLFISESIVPYASSESNDIWKYEVEKRKRGQFYGSHQIWYHGKNSIYWIKHFDYEKRMIFNPSFYFFRDDFTIHKKIEASEGEWVTDHWVIRNVIVQEIRENGGYGLKRHDTYDLFIPESPDMFIKEVKDPEEMSVLEIRAYANQMKRDGYENTRYLVNMHVKIAYYAVIFIMVIIGVSVPLSQNKVRIPLSVSIGIGVCFAYVLVFGLSRSLGLSGRIPPLLAAWLSNGLFLLLGAYLLTLVRR